MRGRVSYAALRAHREPNALLVRAVHEIGTARGRALDIGAGPLNDSAYLVRAGFSVQAVDPDPQTRALAAGLGTSDLEVVQADIRDFPIAAGSYSLIVAIHVLPFVPRSDLVRAAASIVAGLAPGGVLCATFLGLDDTWAGRRPLVNFLSRRQVEDLLSPLEPVELSEVRYDGINARGGPKRWHVHRCIHRQPGLR